MKACSIKTNSKLTCYLGFALIILLTSCNTNPGKTKAEKVSHLMTKAFENQKFVGNVLVADSGKIIYKNSFGEAEPGIPNSDSTKFLIASLSKPFTAVLILKLVEQGKIKVTDRLGKYFRKAENPQVEKVTIHQLLTHTSGMKEFIQEKRKFKESDLVGAGFNFDPGSDFEYSNSGYVLLKEIAEISTGTSYHTLVQEFIFTPLQMNSSGVAAQLDSIPNLAIGHTNAEQKQPEKISYSLSVVDGAGSLYSTSPDIARFSQGLNSKSFLSEPLRELMFRQHVKEKFGYGWYLRERGGVWDVSYHKGDLPGYTSFLSRRASTGQMILLLSNASGLPLDDLENDIAKVLREKE